MTTDDKLDEARSLAEEIVALSPEQAVRKFHAEMKLRRLGKLVRRLDNLALRGGEDSRLATAALQRLGFAAERR